MKISFLFLFLSLSYLNCYSTDSTEIKKPSTFNVGLSQDSYYGFTAYGIGFHPLKKKISLGYYIISRSMQFGAGISWAINPRLYVMPTLGLINGKSLSGGPNPVIAEGIVPGLLITYYGKKIYFDETFLYYKSSRKEGPVTSDYLWFWITLGYSISPKFSAGVHYEQLYLSRLTDGKSSNQFQAIGPYVQTNLKRNASVRVTAGYDFINDEFIRVGMMLHFTD
jgi:hypothetical protein